MNANKCEVMWTNVNKCEQIWTNVFEPFLYPWQKTYINSSGSKPTLFHAEHFRPKSWMSFLNNPLLTWYWNSKKFGMTDTQEKRPIATALMLPVWDHRWRWGWHIEINLKIIKHIVLFFIKCFQILSLRKVENCIKD